MIKIILLGDILTISIEQNLVQQFSFNRILDFQWNPETVDLPAWQPGKEFLD